MEEAQNGFSDKIRIHTLQSPVYHPQRFEVYNCVATVKVKELNFPDPRSNHLHFIQDSPLPILSILFCYACLCKFGPILMQPRKRFELKYVMIVYNAAQVLANSYYGLKVNFLEINLSLSNLTGVKFQAVYLLLWKHKFNYSCQAVDYTPTEHGLAERDLAYVYFMLKLTDLLDTV